jgi:hypothetical protein
MRNDSELLYAAWQGYSDQSLPVTIEPYLFSSHCWIAYRAGNALAASGRSRPVRAAMSRGYSFKMETAGGNIFLARFTSDLQSCQIERLTE